MIWREGKLGNGALVGLALFAVLLFYGAEKSARPIQQPRFKIKLKAAELYQKAQGEIAAHLNAQGITIDVLNDPWRSGLIGEERTPITSDRGVAAAKILTTNPNWAAAMVELLYRAGVRKGDVVAVGMTGSFPGMNAALFAACAALDIKPISIISVGASDWGANRPDLTWLDMERIIVDGNVWEFRSVAASIGGGGDYGRGLSSAGREMIRAAVARNGVALIEEKSLEGNIERRLQIYDSAESEAGRIACFVNIGGGLANMGGELNDKLIPPGVSRRLPKRNYPVRAAINRFAERGVPVINISNVVKIAEMYDLPTIVVPEPPALGVGSLYFKDEYDITIAIILTVLLAVVVFVVIRIDLRSMLFRRRPEPTAH